MGSRSGGGGVQGILAGSRKMVQSLKEIVNGVSDVEIYVALKECNMDPNEAVNRLLSQVLVYLQQVCREKLKHPRTWENVNHVKGAFIVNLGDMMERWTNCLFRSTLHRVMPTGKEHYSEKLIFKEQIEALLRENSILKRAVAIQHERQKEYEERNQEVQQLKQMISQYQERCRTLEVTNYALQMHLRQAEESSSIPGRFHPDIF